MLNIMMGEGNAKIVLNAQQWVNGIVKAAEVEKPRWSSHSGLWQMDKNKTTTRDATHAKTNMKQKKNACGRPTRL